MIRAGVIGLGGIGKTHLNNLKRIEQMEISAICDIDKYKLEVAQEKFGGESYLDFREMLEKQDLDAVLICTPPSVRYEPIKEVAKKRIPLFCEKPPALVLGEAKRVERVLEKYPVINSVGFMWRYNRIIDMAKELMKGQTVSLMRSILLCPAALKPSTPSWFLLKDRSGGPLLDQAIHLIDASRYLLGDISRVQSFGNNLVLPKTEHLTIEDSHSLNLRFCSDIVGTHLHSWAYRSHYIAQIELFGENISLIIDYANNTIQGEVDGNRIQKKMEDVPKLTEMKTFLKAVEVGDAAAIRSPYSDAVRTLSVVIAANRSLETGRVEEVA